MGSRKCPTPRSIPLVVLMVCTFAASVASFVWALYFRLRLVELQANMSGDPEKKFVDECLRDFEHLPVDHNDRKEQRKRCVEDLVADERFKRLPRIRLAMDDRVCDVEDLCDDGDPGQCADRGGDANDAGFQAGDVTKCYQLIEQSKIEADHVRQGQLLDEVGRKCMKQGRWEDYEHRVQLEYCMWKHTQSGVCTNKLRTNCPTDNSCCPAAQNVVHGATSPRTDAYECRKSPLVGLFCQHIDYTVPGTVNASAGNAGVPCTAETCDPGFGWCRDLADVPGLCLHDACKDYWRAATAAVCCCGLAALGIVFDFFDALVLVRRPNAARPKAAANIIAACTKGLGYILYTAGDVRSFAEAAVSHGCFNDAGTWLATDVTSAGDSFVLVALISAGGSLLLAPITMRYSYVVAGLPYARVR